MNRGSKDAEKIPILLTSAIKVSAPFTELSDLSARIAATLRSVSRWTAMCGDAKFIFCDGSGFDMSREFEISRSIDSGRIEVLTFQNDRALVTTRGKGYGEGQIVRHALENSAILKSANSFAKCTGKLWVDNYLSCRKAYNGFAGFSHFGFLKPAAVDTRFFIAQKDFFKATLMDSYVHCDDAAGRYLELVYFDLLDKIDRNQWMLPVYPRIRGVSGTTGKQYKTGILKHLGKNVAIRLIRSRLAKR